MNASAISNKAPGIFLKYRIIPLDFELVQMDCMVKTDNGISKNALRLNIGCGLAVLPNFHNIDNSPSVILGKVPWLKWILYRVGVIKKHHYETQWPRDIIWADASRRLPYPTNSVSKIYSSHFLEHISEKNAIGVLKECFRVLKSQGRFRLVVPDLLIYTERYVKETRKLFQQNPVPLDRNIHDEFMHMVCGGWLKKARRGAFHLYMYDYPTLLNILSDIGYRDIMRCEYRKGEDPELASLDNRPDDSLIIEMVK